MRWKTALAWCLAWASTAVGGCVTQNIQFDVWDATLITAPCTCSVCWNRPFCYSPDEPGVFQEPVGGVCPAGLVLAADASRVTSWDSRETFFCIPPNGIAVDAEPLLAPDPVLVSPAGGYCPSPVSPERASIAHLDPCVDVLFECRDPGDSEFVGCSALPPDTSSCPAAYQRGVEVTGCGEDEHTGGLDLAVTKVVAACAHGRPSAVPSGSAPERYCYTACLDRRWTAYGEGICTESLFDPPEITAGAYEWVLEGTGSSATVTYGSETVTLPIVGRVAFHSPRCLAGQTCPAELSYLEAAIPTSFTLGGSTFSSTVLQNPIPIRNATVSPLSATVSKVEIPFGAEIFATSDVSTEPVRTGVLMTAPDMIVGQIDWDLRTIDIDATFVETSTSTTVVLSIHGSIPNRAPIADAGPDIVAECTSPYGARVALDGTDSFDPDKGTDDDLIHNWNGVPPATPLWSRGGPQAKVDQPIGTRDYDLNVRDLDGSATTDSVRVTVEDTTQPSFSWTAIPECIANDGQLRLFRASDFAAAFADVCDDSLSIQLFDVFGHPGSVSPQPDIVEGTTQFCLRGQREGTSSRIYYAKIRGTDDAGNFREVEIPIVVPAAGAACPRGYFAYSSHPAVSAADPECTE